MSFYISHLAIPSHNALPPTLPYSHAVSHDVSLPHQPSQARRAAPTNACCCADGGQAGSDAGGIAAAVIVVLLLLGSLAGLLVFYLRTRGTDDQLIPSRSARQSVASSGGKGIVNDVYEPQSEVSVAPNGPPFGDSLVVCFRVFDPQPIGTGFDLQTSTT